MKKWMMIVMLCCGALMGCSEKNYEPREIVSETDVCKICNMSIVHNAYAGEIALKNGDYEIFDDIGCLMEHIKANGEDEIGAAYIKDAAKNEWIDVFNAVYVYNKDYWTPMNYGVVAFDSKEAAQEWMTKEGEGQLLAYKDLHDFKWGIHK